MAKQFAHVFIGCLREIFVILTDSLKEFGCAQADCFVGLFFDLVAGIRWTNRHCYDNFRGSSLSQCLYRSAHRGACGQSIIHQNGDPIPQLGCGAAFPVDLFAPTQFFCLSRRNGLNCLVCVRYRTHDIFIQNTHSARSDCAGGQLLETRDAEFTHYKNVEWRAQVPGNFISNRHTAARQPQHDNVIATGVFLQVLRELPPCFGSI